MSGSFIARDKEGQEYEIVRSTHGGRISLRTASGRFVQREGKGRYVIQIDFGDDIPVTSDDPAAP